MHIKIILWGLIALMSSFGPIYAICVWLKFGIAPAIAFNLVSLLMMGISCLRFKKEYKCFKEVTEHKA